MDAERQKRIDGLRAKRASKLAEDGNAFRRSRDIGRISAIVDAALRISNSSVAFDKSLKFPLAPTLAENFQNCPGLAAPYIAKGEARKILNCCNKRGGVISGALGFSEYHYVGLLPVVDVSLVSLLDISEKLNDATILWSVGHSSFIVVDFYKQSWTDKNFSILVQRGRLLEAVKDCFNLRQCVGSTAEPA